MRVATIVWAVLMLMFVAMPVGAQYHGDDDDEPISGETESAFRFHLELPVFRYVKLTQTIEFMGMEDETSVSIVSLGGPTGLVADGAGVGLGFGYAVIESVVIGAALNVGFESFSVSEVDDASRSQMFFGLAPYFEYLGGDSSTKPFIGAMLQLRRSGTTDRGSGADDSSSQTMVGAGVLGGAHFFLSEGCSVDLTGKLSYSVVVASDPDLPDGASISMLDFLVTLGVSAWVL